MSELAPAETGDTADGESSVTRVDGRSTRSRREVPLVESVRRRILEDIITGMMPPNSLVQLSNLAEQYGVSRTPVREALSVLEREGLITSLPYKGFLIRGIEPADVHDLYLVRRIIEGAAAGLAAGKLSQEALEALADQRPPMDKTMTPTYDHYARNFHEVIVHASGSSRLRNLFDTVYNDVRRVQYAEIVGPCPDLVHAEHRKIIAALAAGDARAAQEAMEEHIVAIHERLIQAWLNMSTKPTNT